MVEEQSERCPAIHPTLGLQCERLAKHCVGPGIDHTAKREDGTHALWPNQHGTTPMHKYFQDLEQPGKPVCPICEKK